MNKPNIYAEKQCAARLSCAGQVILDPLSTDDDRAAAERDLTGDGSTEIDFDLLARSSPKSFLALCNYFAAVREETPAIITGGRADLADQADANARAPRALGVVAPEHDPDAPEPDAP